MKKFIKFCTITGLVLLLLGIGTTTVSAGLGGRFRDTIPYRVMSRLWDRHIGWYGVWGDRRNHTGRVHMDMWNDGEDWHDRGRQHVYGGTDSGVDIIPSVSDTENPAVPGGEDLYTFDMVRKLDVDIDKGTVHIYESQDVSQVSVRITDEFNKTTCYMDEETLNIKRRNRNKVYDYPQIEILVPTGSHFDKLSLDMGTAECEIWGVSASKLDFDTGVGSVIFNGSLEGDADLETGVGSITLNLDSSERDYNYKVECGVGVIKIGGSEYTMMSSDKRIDNQSSYTMDLECGVGDITINFNQSV